MIYLDSFQASAIATLTGSSLSFTNFKASKALNSIPEPLESWILKTLSGKTMSGRWGIDRSWKAAWRSLLGEFPVDLEGRMWLLTVCIVHGRKSKLSSVAAGVETTFLLIPYLYRVKMYLNQNTTVSFLARKKMGLWDNNFYSCLYQF